MSSSTTISDPHAYFTIKQEQTTKHDDDNNDFHHSTPLVHEPNNTKTNVTISNESIGASRSAIYDRNINNKRQSQQYQQADNNGEYESETEQSQSDDEEDVKLSLTKRKNKKTSKCQCIFNCFSCMGQFLKHYWYILLLLSLLIMHETLLAYGCWNEKSALLSVSLNHINEDACKQNYGDLQKKACDQSNKIIMDGLISLVEECVLRKHWFYEFLVLENMYMNAFLAILVILIITMVKDCWVQKYHFQMEERTRNHWTNTMKSALELQQQNNNSRNKSQRLKEITN